jgi:hypothetical protein
MSFFFSLGFFVCLTGAYSVNKLASSPLSYRAETRETNRQENWIDKPTIKLEQLASSTLNKSAIHPENHRPTSQPFSKVKYYRPTIKQIMA